MVIEPHGERLELPQYVLDVVHVIGENLVTPLPRNDVAKEQAECCRVLADRRIDWRRLDPTNQL